MFKTLDRLRERPEDERKTIALLGAFLITLFIVGVWFFLRFIGTSGDTPSATAPGPIESTLSLLSSVFLSTFELF